MQEWSKEQIYELITRADDAAWNGIKDQAFAVRRRVFGNRVFLRGLIELTNYCKNDCYYCGIRRSSRAVSRYRLEREEVILIQFGCLYPQKPYFLSSTQDYRASRSCRRF